VDHHRVLGAGEPRGQPRDVILPLAALPLLDLVLHVGVAARDRDQALDRRGRERRPPQVGVQHDPGRVDHRAQAGTHEGRRPPRRAPPPPPPPPGPSPRRAPPPPPGRSPAAPPRPPPSAARSAPRRRGGAKRHPPSAGRANPPLQYTVSATLSA